MSAYPTSLTSSIARAPFAIWAARAVAIALAWSSTIGWPQEEKSTAKEPSGADLAIAIESRFVDAIAKGERSVVSIARVDTADEGVLAERDKRDGLLNDRFPPPDPIDTVPGDARDPGFVPQEFATGVIVDASGLILTNHHVLGERSRYWITTVDRKIFEAKPRGADPRSDLAVLEIVDKGAIRPDDFTPMAFGDTSRLRKGMLVISLGNPYSIARDGQASASWGIISNLGRKSGPSPSSEGGLGKDTLHHFGGLIQTDAKLNLGTSGGALLNLKGEMIGLTTSQAALAGYEQAAGFAIPVDATFLRVLEKLKRGEEAEFGLLGIRPANLSPSDRTRGAKGVQVSWVRAGTPAARAGIQQNDIIEKIGGTPILDTDDLMTRIGGLAPASETTLQVLSPSTGRSREVRVTLAKFRVAGRKIVTSPAPSWRGMRVDFVSTLEEDEISSRARGLGFGGLASDSEDAVVAVIEVEPNSPTWKAGLRRGDLITHVGAVPLDSPAAFHEQTNASEGAIELRIAIGNSDESPIVKIEPN